MKEKDYSGKCLTCGWLNMNDCDESSGYLCRYYDSRVSKDKADTRTCLHYIHYREKHPLIRNKEETDSGEKSSRQYRNTGSSSYSSAEQTGRSLSGNSYRKAGGAYRPSQSSSNIVRKVLPDNKKSRALAIAVAAGVVIVLLAAAWIIYLIIGGGRGGNAQTSAPETTEIISSGQTSQAESKEARPDNPAPSAWAGMESGAADYTDIQLGDYITFGNYEGTPIEWVVVEKEAGCLKLVSRYLLFKTDYNDRCTSITWENSSIRSWLNHAFYTSSFSEAEQTCILETDLTTDDNPKYGKDGGNPTTDRIFLLSVDEAEEYFASDNSRAAGYVDSDSASWWWLRTPGVESNFAVDVYNDGSISLFGTYVHDPGGIRPAMWIRPGF